MEEREARELRDRLDRLKHSPEHGSPAHGGSASTSSNRNILHNRYILIGIMALIVLLAIFLRIGLARYSGFFEPDGFFHYSVIRQAITANGYIVPMNLSLSGFPEHNAVTEPTGLYYATIIPYIFLQYLGVSYYTIERFVAVFFGVLDVLGAYFLTKYMTNSRVGGLITMLFVAISSGDIAKNAALIYDGEGFVTIFVILALIFFVKSIVEKDRRKRQYMYVLLASLSLDAALFVWGGAPFALVLYIVAVALLILYGFIIGEGRIIKAAVLLSLGLLLFYAIEWVMILTTILRYVPALGSWHFFVFYIPLLLGSLAAYYLITRKEVLPAITLNIRRRAAFSFVLLAIVLIALVALFPNAIAAYAGASGASNTFLATIEELQSPTLSFVWGSFSYQLILAPIGVVLFLIFRKRIAKENLQMATMAFIAVFAYFITTSYLQYTAIRYNSLVSVPIAIFSGYAVYTGIKLLYNHRIKALRYAIIAAFAILIILNFKQTVTTSFSSVQADGIDPGFLTAMAWMYNNTPTNATVLDLWPDGSVVEGWAQRTSYTDSVGGQTGSKIYNFSRWLFAENPAPYFLINASRPDYLVARGYWLYELGGIAQEGNITNSSLYGYDQMTSLNVYHETNQTTYFFNSSAYPYYNAELVVQPGPNGTSAFAATIGAAGQPTRAPIAEIIFVNQSGGRYSIAKSNASSIQDYSLAVYYNGTRITGGALLGQAMADSNFFRFTTLCNVAYCPYNASGITMNVVYSNYDTKIIKINYQ